MSRMEYRASRMGLALYSTLPREEELVDRLCLQENRQQGNGCAIGILLMYWVSLDL